MNIQLQKTSIKQKSAITITGSKSESNRLLLLQALFPTIGIQNISNADDAVLMQKAFSAKMDLKKKRDHDRHHNNPKLK